VKHKGDPTTDSDYTLSCVYANNSVFFLNSGSQPGGRYPFGASANLQWGHNKTYNYLNYLQYI